jgi:hypothetical protein
MRIMFCLCRLGLPVAALLCGLNGAGAQGDIDVRQACTPDAMRLCADVIPDVPKVTACMKAKHAQLSQECRTAMASGRHHGHGHRHRGHGHSRHSG